ncbi:MAG: cobalt transporter, permease protein CbiQ [Anaerosolibacter sp.]|jgi:cobalt/nickel transport system permease protein|uniref:cobalt ECF transporter T component CbiQ n=1 Tax=Anaerosolibacter sp. TaxID=1872527 RepID=UPI00262AEC89|nr:cobalt ECF transporter T component CbiQ [Anaerosolibacter sp.]MDF2545180.1 cobalt transporter, permease protein CbiQ [Anaerosolibacter sp.]
MANFSNTLYNMGVMNDLARKDTPIHRIHPLAKVLTTFVYLLILVSFDRYEISGLLPLIFYPLLVFLFAELPAGPILKRILFVEPFIIGIGILNPFFDQEIVIIGGIALSRGWITFFSIFIKSGLAVTAGLLLMATTGMDKLAAALRLLKIPRLFVLQLLLTYRYISLLMEEVARTIRAYSLRAPTHKGVHRSAWGSLAGQLLLRTLDRAQRIYQAMCLRGFTGEYHTGEDAHMQWRDFIYVISWSIFFVIIRLYNIPMVIGALLMGVIR